MIKAILFDLDGVLVDACDWHYHSLNDALLKHKGFTISYEDHIKKYNGLPTNVKLNLLGLKEEEKKSIWKMKQEKTLYNIKKYGTIDKYKIRMLQKLKQENYKLACVTNSIKMTAVEMLKVTGQFQLIDLLISNEDVNNNKPSPDCYLLALDTLGISKEEALIIEDSPKGKKSAYASGAKVIEVKDIYDVTYDKIRSHIR